MSLFGYLTCSQGTVYSPEVQVFDRKLGLNDACGFDSGS